MEDDYVEARARGRYTLEGPDHVDLIVSRVVSAAAPTPQFEAAWARRCQAPVATGSAVRVVLPCIDDLIAMKEAAGRPKDRDDVQALRALSRLASDAGSGRDGEDNR